MIEPNLVIGGMLAYHLGFSLELTHNEGAIFRCNQCGELSTSYFPAVVQKIPDHIMRQLQCHVKRERMKEKDDGNEKQQ
jgi:hypothetical protein